MIKDYEDILSSLNFENIIDNEQLNEVVDKAIELANSMKKLRDTYKSASKLPLSSYNDDYKNMEFVSDLIEQEFLKFGTPVKIIKKYTQMSKNEIETIKRNPMDLSVSGLDKWLEEGLI